jgi:hypothetical protein
MLLLPVNQSYPRQEGYLTNSFFFPAVNILGIIEQRQQLKV